MQVRYLEEVTEMSRKLASLSYDEQIISLEWTNTYKDLIDTEEKLAGLPLATTPKQRDAIEDKVANLKRRVVEIQEQRDIFQQAVQLIMDRCTVIKATLKHEKALEDLRLEMTAQLKADLISS